MRAMIFRAALMGSFLFVSPVLAEADNIAPSALNSFSVAPSNLMGAKVMDQNGHLLGQVTQVQADANGHPAALAFRPLAGKHVVVVSAAAASFDGRTVVADNSQPQIAALADTRVAKQ